MRLKKILFLIVFAVGCSKEAPTEELKAKPLLLVSIAPYQFLAEQIAGKEFSVITVVPSGANPHAYEPTSRQVTEIARGAIWFQVGEPFEKKIFATLYRQNPSLQVVDLREGVDLLEVPSLHCLDCSMDHKDRHMWLSPKLFAEQASIMAGVLAEKFPEKRELFFENAKRLSEDLYALDLEIDALLSSVKERVLLVSHPAFGYFCRDYHFEQLSVEYEGKDPRPKHLEEVLLAAMQTRADLALALPQHNNKGAQLIAEKLQLPVRMIDPYSPHYFEMLRELAHIIADPQYHP